MVHEIRKRIFNTVDKLAIDQRESKAEHTEHFKLTNYSSVPCFYLFISFIKYK